MWREVPIIPTLSTVLGSRRPGVKLQGVEQDIVLSDTGTAAECRVAVQAALDSHTDRAGKLATRTGPVGRAQPSGHVP